MNGCDSLFYPYSTLSFFHWSQLKEFCLQPHVVLLETLLQNREWIFIHFSLLLKNVVCVPEDIFGVTPIFLIGRGQPERMYQRKIISDAS